MGKPTGKQILILNLVNNVPLAVLMSTLAPILSGQKIQMGTWLLNVGVAFVLACLINVIFPIPRWSIGIPTKFGLDPHGIKGRVVSNMVIALLFVIIIGLILTYINVPIIPVFIFAFLSTALPIYVSCVVVAFFTTSIANKWAFGEVKK
jgi:hypothetical protein